MLVCWFRYRKRMFILLRKYFSFTAYLEQIYDENRYFSGEILQMCQEQQEGLFKYESICAGGTRRINNKTSICTKIQDIIFNGIKVKYFTILTKI